MAENDILFSRLTVDIFDPDNYIVLTLTMKLYLTLLMVCCFTGFQLRAQLPAKSEIEDTATAKPLLEGMGKGFFTSPDS
ncbi:MAG TPA: hypothetical protein VK166_05105, partial [Chitinophagaceae bacterium]|nr:hypothetical protein [Chitinophagaceae bacterium]